MDFQDILKTVDHTILSVDATWPQVMEILDDAVRFGVASACIPPCYVGRARDYVGSATAICTVIGFPNGYSSTPVKVFEAQQALADGADEIDMVINIGWLKEGLFDQIAREIQAVKEACGRHILKVIVETCLLTEKEKIAMCDIVTRTGADFIKTSTGFSAAGAHPHDIMLFAGHVGPNVKIKAAGGISTLEEARRFLDIGAHRLGTSRIVALCKQQKKEY